MFALKPKMAQVNFCCPEIFFTEFLLLTFEISNLATCVWIRGLGKLAPAGLGLGIIDFY
jgi:hypothetical protein